MTTSWDIQGFRDTGRGTEQLETIATVHELEYSGEWMGDEYVTVTVKSPVPIEFKHGDYLVYRGTNYTIDYDPNVIKKAKTIIENDVKKGTYGEGFVYENIKLYAESRELKDVMFKDYVLNDNGKAYSKQTRFSFFAGSVEDLADRLYANLKLVFRETWKVYTPSLSRTQTRLNSYGHWSDYYVTDKIAGNTDVNVSCDGISCLDALKLAYDLFGLSYHIIGTNIIIAAEKGLILKEGMRYGKWKDFFEIEKNTDDSRQVVTKMYAYGSSDNMPLNYYANLYKTPYLTGVKYIYTEKGKTYYGINTTIPYEDCKNALNGQDGILRIRKASGFSCVGKKDTHTSSGIKYLRINFLADGESVVINGETVTGNASAFYTAISNNETLYFTYGIEQNAWPQSYIQTGGDYPALLSISHLMLPGFPKKSLYQWALENQWTAVDVTKGKATKDGKTYYFSKDEKSPWIKSVNADVIGEREGSVYFDGSSNDTDNIHPTIENTNAANVTSDTTITDNGYLPEGSDLSFKLNVSKGILAWDGAWDSRQEDIYVNMKSGYCTGRAFKLLKRPVMKSDHWELKLERSKDGSLDRYFPYSEGVGSDYAQIKTGDTFVVTGIQLPDSYVDAASVTLFDAALKELDKMDHPKQTYIPKINELEVARERDSQNDGTGTFYYRVRPGMKMMFRDSDIIGNAMEISRFIDNVTIKENGNNGIPTFSVVLRDEKEESFRQLIQNEISSLSSGSGSSSSGGGMTESQIYEITDEKVDTDWFSQLFEVHKITKSTTQGGQDTDEIIPPNEYDKLEADDNTISIEAKYGFWTEKFISAMGKNDDEEDEPFSLNKPLSTINETAYFETHDPTEGDAIVYKNGTWQFGKAGSEGDTLKSDILKSINENTISPLGTLQNGHTVVYDGSKWKYGNVLNSVLKGINDNSASPGILGEYGMLAYMGSTWKYTTMPHYLTIENSDFLDSSGKPYAAGAPITNGEFTVDISPLLSGYVTVDWFKKLFKVHVGNDTDGTNVVNPNAPMSGDAYSIEAMFGFWTKKYISALGTNGNTDDPFELGTLLSAINNSIIGSQEHGADGTTIVWKNGAWVFGTTGSNYIHPSHTARNISAADRYFLGSIEVDSLGHVTNVSSKLLSTNDFPDTYGDSKNPYGQKTKNYVLAAPSNAAGYPTFRALAADDIPSMTRSKITDMPTSWWGQQVTSETSGGTTTYKVEGDMSGVGNIAFSASGKNIGGLVYFFKTANDTNSQMRVSQTAVSSKYTYTHIDDTITPRLYIDGYLGVGGNIYSQAIELYYSTPHIDFHYNNSTSDFTTRIIENNSGVLSVTVNTGTTGFVVGSKHNDYIQIGNIRIVYDNADTNGQNALKVVKADGTAANFYATGSVSALGAGTASGQSTFDENAMWDALATNDATHKISNSHLNLTDYATTQMLADYVKGVKFNNGTAKLPDPTTGIVDLGTISVTGDYLPLSGGTMQNTNVVKNLNADLLDGKHLEDITKTLSVKVGDADVLSYTPEEAKTLTFAAAANSGISVEGASNTITIGYTLPTAGTGKNGTKGGIKVGSTLSIDTDAVLNLASVSGLTAGTYRSVTVDEYGRVTAGTNPTTLAGYGISSNDDLFSSVTVGSADRLSGTDTCSIWGQEYWKNGVPKGVTGRLSLGSSDIYWKENNYGDQFSIEPSFSGTDDSNILQFKSAVGASGTTPSMTTKMVIAGKSGYVGIGTTSPQYTLDVTGNIRATAVSWFPSVELYANAPYIDFHKGATTASDEPDYTTRIIENTSGVLSVMAKTGTTGLVVGSQNADYIQIGDIRIGFDSDNNALKVYKMNGTTEVAANFYAMGAVSALGAADSSGQSTFDEAAMWDALIRNSGLYENTKIHSGHLNLTGYATTSLLSDYMKGVKVNGTTYNTKDANGIVDIGNFGLEKINVNAGNQNIQQIRVATITFSATGLQCASFTALFSASETVGTSDKNSFILHVLIRREATVSNASYDISSTKLGENNPPNAYIVKVSDTSFQVYIDKKANMWSPYFRMVALQKDGNITFENVAENMATPVATATITGGTPIDAVLLTGEQTVTGAKTFTQGILLKDSANNPYRGIYDNGANLWIGASESAGYHHRGSTHISAGWNGTAGNETIYVSVPSSNSTAGGNSYKNYGVWHAGNLTPADYLKKDDAKSLTINADSASVVTYNPKATNNTTLTFAKGDNISFDTATAGQIKISSSIPTASSSTLGGVKVNGNGLKIEDGVLKANLSVSDIPDIYLLLDGTKTMTGVLSLKSSQFSDSYSGALNMNNSNIYGLNGIYTQDLADGPSEGYNFYRDATHVDSFHIKNGVMYFTPNRELGKSGTSYKIWHSNDHPTTLSGYGITDAVKDNVKWWGASINNGEVKGSMTNVGNISFDTNGTRDIGSATNLANAIFAKGGYFFGDTPAIYAGESSSSFVAVHWSKYTDTSTGVTTRTRGILDLYGGVMGWIVGYNGTNTFLNKGNVGIGTESPSQKLDVNGNVKATRFYLTDQLYFEVDGTSIKCNGNFYATGAVSALGAASGGSGFSLGNLLNDLNSTQAVQGTPSNGQTLVYNGGWTFGKAGSDYTLPTASATTLGGVKVNGNGLKIESGVLKVNLSASDIPNLSGTYVTLTTDQTISGTKTFSAAIATNGGITPIASGSVTTASGGNKLWIKRASVSSDGTPNNGLVFEYGSGSTLTGQLWMSDNGSEGLYWNGWYNGTYQSWKKFAFTTDNVASATKLYTKRKLWGQEFNGEADVDGKLFIDLASIGSTTVGTQYSLIDSRYKNASGSTFGTQSVLSLIGSGETSTCYNMGVRLGSQSGMTWISAGESGGTLSSVYTGMCNTEDVYVSADGGIHFITGASNDSSSYNRAMDILTNGNVGIGTPSPNTALDVNGVINSRSNITAQGYLSVGSYVSAATYVSAASYVKIGNLYIIYDQNNNALKVSASATADTSANFYATGAVSALGAGTSGGGSTGDFSAIVNSLNQSSTAVGTGFLYSNGGAWSFQSTSSFWKTTDFTLKNYTTAQDLGWIGTAEDAKIVLTSNSLAYWNGRYNASGSNLAYCKHGAFGTMATQNTTNYVAKGGGAFIGDVTISADFYVTGAVGVGGSVVDGYTLYVNGNANVGGVLKMYSTQSGDGAAFLRTADTTVQDMTISANVLYLEGNEDIFANMESITSDMRLKDINRFLETTIETISLAPIFDFSWKNKNNKKLHLGTSAQYWQQVFPNAISQMRDGYLAMDYGATALASAVITARKVVDHEQRIKELEKENERLMTEVELLKAA